MYLHSPGPEPEAMQTLSSVILLLAEKTTDMEGVEDEGKLGDNLVFMFCFVFIIFMYLWG